MSDESLPMCTFLAVGCRRALAMIPGSNAGGGTAADVVTDCVVGCAREAEDGCGTSMGTDKTTSVGEFFWLEDIECAPPANSIIACACKHRNQHTQILDMWKSPTITTWFRRGDIKNMLSWHSPSQKEFHHIH